MLQTPVGLLDPEWFLHQAMSVCLRAKKMSETKKNLYLVAALSKGALLPHPPELLVSETPPSKHREEADEHHQVPAAPQALHCSDWTKIKSATFENQINEKVSQEFHIFNRDEHLPSFRL